MADKEVVKKGFGSNSLVVGGVVVVVLVLIVLSVGNSVSDKMIPKIMGSTWMVDEFKNLSATSETDFEIWPEIYDQTAKDLGFDSWKQWVKARQSDSYGEGQSNKIQDIFKNFSGKKRKLPYVSAVDFQNSLESHIVANQDYSNRHATPVRTFLMWRSRPSDWYSDNWFRTEFGLTNPVKWYAWLIYVKIYSL